MKMIEACSVIAQGRGDAVIVATMGAMFLFDALEVREGRINSVPLMGGAACLGLGLAMGRPERRVIVVDGDASLLMELGGLVSVAGQRPRNLLHVVLRNGTQFTGLANLKTPIEGCDLAAHARAAGYAQAERFDDAAGWAAGFARLKDQPGPCFAELRVEPLPSRLAAGAGAVQTEMPDLQFTRMGDEARALRTWLRAPAS
ncbi:MULTISPECIES: thiamine pyrophosphate-dependent enzyme [unclassified Variovorax]|uniref:thiamine pyrophosphate-dependent enzyme n=1 Tax=unclassified Variovorax TaxID=663243 RepID=UPI0021BA4F27|nr:thiamine pyrophosphate-dependent enzyme [Variovorax sp. CY25R-8]MCT8178174.1 thiamine pyrophosphate-binding protein [Variovorax sp. CY25R-8]